MGSIGAAFHRFVERIQQYTNRELCACTCCAYALEGLEHRVLLTVPFGTVSFDFEGNQTHTVNAVFTDQPNGQGSPVNVSPSLVKEDIVLERYVGTDNFLPYEQILLNYSGANPAKFTFTGFQHPSSVRPNILPNANYRASISKQDVQNGSDQMAADAVADFFVLAADANRSRNVNLQDFNVLAANYGQSGRTFSQGNYDYDPDGNVDDLDYGVLKAHFGLTMPVPPSGPNEIMVTARALPDLRFDLAWIDGVTGETGWRVQYSLSGQFDDLVYLPDLPTNSTGTTSPTFPDGTRVWWRSRAFGNGQDTAYSPKRYATTPLPAPTGVSALPINGNQVRVTWTDASQNESEFQIFQSSSPTGGFAQIGTAPRNATEFFAPIPDPPGQRYYYVRAHNDVIDSAPSTVAASPPAPPSNVTVAYVSATQLNIDWADNAESGVTYNVYRGTDSEFEPDPATNRIASNLTTSNFPDTMVSPSTRYHYKVTSVANGVESPHSDPVTEVTAVNAQPNELEVSVVDESAIEVFWSDNSANETGFLVDVYNGVGQLLFTDSVSANSDFYEVTGLA
jgi:hypothetical protein